MSGLSGGLLALAALFADRAVAHTRHAATLRSLGVRPSIGRARRRAFPSWAWAAIVGAIGWWLGGVPVALGGLVAGEAARRVRRRAAASREAERLQEQLADAVRTIVAGLRAGLSIPQAIGYADRGAGPPLADGLSALVSDLDSGATFDDAITGWAERTGGEDPRLIASVLRLYRRTGGDLPMVLDRVGDTLRERSAARREIRALTAQARLSGAILGLLPIAFFGILWLTSRSDIEGALRTPAGLLSVSLGVAMEAAAFVWIRRLLEVR